MGGKSSSNTISNTSQSQQSTTAPWAPTQPYLTNIVGGLPNPATAQPTQYEQNALGQLQGNALGLPNYGSQAQGVINNLLSGGNTQGNLSNYQQQLAPYLTPGYLDPMQTPGLSDALKTMQSDITNSINGQFAGAGRDLSGANTQALARGLTQGMAPLIMGQYNTNVGNQLGSMGNLYNAGNTTTGLQAGLQQAGLGQIPNLPGIVNQSPEAQLQASQTARGLPISNLGQLLNLILPIAGLGSQNQGTATGTGTSNTTNQMSGAQQFATIMGGLGSLFGGRR